MPALVLIFPLIAMCWDQGLYPHHAAKRPEIIPPVAAAMAAEPVRWIFLDKPYLETITFITEVR